MIERFEAAGAALVCPACRGFLRESAASLECSGCGRAFPVVSGIPDLRLQPDRFLSQRDDRAKGLAALEKAGGRGFSGALEAYWAMTPELQPALAAGHIRRQQGEVAVGGELLAELGAAPTLDLGCGSGGLLAAAGQSGRTLIGLDAAFRWLLIGRERLRELGLDPPLVCANAESLPFADGSLPSLCANDLLEHVAEPRAAVAEMARTLAPGGWAYAASNNRFSILPEPHVRLPGVGWLPRAWQGPYVRALRGHDYQNVRLPGGAELRGLFECAGLTVESLRPAPLFTAHLEGGRRSLLQLSNRLHWPAALAPRVAVRARKPAPVG
ncbi:MAG: methyltransferase domain-containing protein [Acidobacteria bacterium]|nr:methyltransferase domain-containing protein [Acidobacteriota bacterium]